MSAAVAMSATAVRSVTAARKDMNVIAMRKVMSVTVTKKVRRGR
jgi:hypothetical protein